MVAFKKNSNNNSKLNRILNNRSSSSDFLSKNWLYCRWVLYTVFILSIGNIYYLLLGGDYFTLAVFILVAFLTTFFSKNMVVILCISLVISTILKSVQVKEGLELSKNDLNTIDKVINKIGGGGKDTMKGEKDDSENDTDSSKKTDKTDKTDDSDKDTDSSEKTDKTDKTDKKEKTEKTEKTDKPEKKKDSKDSDKKKSK